MDLNFLGNAGIVDLLLKSGADINTMKGSNDRTPLISAAVEGKFLSLV